MSMVMFIVLAVSALLLFLYQCVIKPHRYWKEKGIPYVFPIPFLGCMALNTFRKQSFASLLQQLYNTYPEKRYFGVYQFLSPIVVIRDIELIKQITVKEFDSFVDHQVFLPEDIDPLWGKKGDRWRDMRATLSPAFTSSKMKTMFGLMVECAEKFTDHFLKKGEAVTVELRDIFGRYTTDVIATTAYGVHSDSLKDLNNQFYTCAQRASSFSRGFGLIKFFGFSISSTVMKLLRVTIFEKDVKDFFTNVVKKTIKLREEKGIIRPDMLHLLMEARKGRLRYEEFNSKSDSGFAAVEESDVGRNKNSQKCQITDEDIVAQAFIFFLGGYDTTTVVMCHTAYELALNPDIQERLRKEVKETMDKCGGKITYEALLGMKYLDMVVTETLRLWSPGIVQNRMCTKAVTIKPELPDEKPLYLYPGDIVWYPVYGIHRDAEFYPNPEKFDPERYSDENKHLIKPFTFLPFGVGPRNCIGSRFALLETKIIIFHILCKFDIVPVAKTQIPFVLSTSDFNLVSDKGFWLALKPRPL